MTSITFNKITADKQRATKRITFGADSKLHIESGTTIRTGDMLRLQVDDAEGFARVLTRLRKSQCLTYGIPPRDAKLVTTDEWVRLCKPADKLPRTTEVFNWPSGPGILMLDFDAAKDGTAPLTKDELLEVVERAAPDIMLADLIHTPSTSSCIYDNKGNELRGVMGQRLYSFAKDASDIPRAGKALNERLWALGYGRYEISESGALLERGVFDGSVWQTNRIDYCAGAVVGPGLKQKRGKPDVMPGLLDTLLDTRKAIPDLTPAELAAAATNKATAHAAVADRATAVREAYLQARAIGIKDKNREITLEVAREMAQRAVETQTLPPEWELMVRDRDGKACKVTVQTALDNPTKYHNMQARDPMEVNYDRGRWVAKLYLADSHPTIHSKAHGGQTFRLAWEPAQREEATEDDFEDMTMPLPPEQAEARRQRQQERNRKIGEGNTFVPKTPFLSVEQMVDRFVYLSDGSRVFDTRHPKHIVSLPDFRNTTAASYSVIETEEINTRTGKPKKKRLNHAMQWIENGGRKSAYGTTFKAGAGTYVDDPNGRNCVNTWVGFDRKIDGAQGDAAIVIAHIQWLFKDRAEDFLDWLAHIEQHPGELPHTCWLHVAPNTGMGRNGLAGVLSRVFAGHTASSVGLEGMLRSGFNDELSGKVLAVVDEIRTGGDEQWDHAENFKQLITEPVRTINPKFGRKSLEFNACRWLIFSNHRSALPLADNDRRVEVVISDDRPMPPEYYTRLYAAIEDPMVTAAFALFLKQRDIAHFNPGRHAKRTDQKLQVIASNRSRMVQELVEFTEGYPCEVVTARRLQNAAGASAFGKGAAAYGKAARDAGWEPLDRVRAGSNRVRCYVRRERLAYWQEHINRAGDALPTQDGGLVPWAGGADDFEDVTVTTSANG